jgi:hypothetical protein
VAVIVRILIVWLFVALFGAVGGFVAIALCGIVEVVAEVWQSHQRTREFHRLFPSLAPAPMFTWPWRLVFASIGVVFLLAIVGAPHR